MEIDNPFLYRHRKPILVICIIMWIGAFAATHIPGQYIPAGIASFGDCVLHGVGFLGLSSWFILTVTAFGVKPFHRVTLVLAIMIFYGAMDEYTQQFFGRDTEFKDWITDTTAAIIAIMIWETIFYLVHKITLAKLSQNQ